MECVEQFAQPRAEQRVEVVRPEYDRDFFLWPNDFQVAGHDREHRSGRLGEERIEIGGACPQTYVGGMVKEFVHGVQFSVFSFQ